LALQPDVQQLKFGGDFGLKIYYRLVKKYPLLDPNYDSNLQVPSAFSGPQSKFQKQGNNRRNNNQGFNKRGGNSAGY